MFKNARKICSLSKALVDKKTIGYLILFVTARCNLRCRMCFYWQETKKSNSSSELSLKEISKISQNIHQLIHLTLTGGEPFFRDDITAIARYFFDNSQLQSLTIATNGFFSAKIEKAAQELASAYPDKQIRICLSIDGIGQLHDQTRGVKGAFDKVIETHNRLIQIRKKYPNLVVDVNTVFSSFNQNQIITIIKHVNGNFKFNNHYVSLVRGSAREPIAKKVNLQKYKQAINLIEKQAINRQRQNITISLFWALKLAIRDIVYRTALEKKKIAPCLAGQKMIEITESGKVLCCEILGKSMGNLRKVNYDINKLMSSPRAKKILKEIKDNDCFCHFECAIQTGVAYSPFFYPKVAKYILKSFFDTHEKKKN